jgi:sarcosine oxidase
VARPRLVTAEYHPAGSSLPVPHAEFLVIGGGVTGLAAAWALTRRGREVAVLDQAPVGHSRGGSHGTCRIFRLGYDEPVYVTLAGQARALWSELEDACGKQLLLPAPQLTVGPQMPQVHAAMRAAGAACELLTAADAAARFPGVCVAGEILLEPASAVIAADRALASLAGLAGEIRTGVRVTALADDGRRVRVSTTAGDVEAGRVIVCAGPWTSGLLATAGIALPGSATLEQVAYLAPADSTAVGAPTASLAPAFPMPIFVHFGGEIPYGLPVPGTQRYKIGIHHGGPPVEPDHQDHAADPYLVRRIEQVAREFLPGFDPNPVALERCIYDNSPDADFVVDRVGNVVIGSGTSGHGFKFGPLLGEWLASLADDTAGGGRNRYGALSAVADRFALNRF